jgi:pyrrolidone-carboxylate peptidase
MRFLIYGFGPYRQFHENVTEKILRQLPKRRYLKKIVFPVRFHKRQFINAIRNSAPDIILGLGQCSEGRLLRIEARAVNKRRAIQKEKARPIVRGGARALVTNLKLNFGRAAERSRNAGDYVCNYSMYVMLDFLKRHRLSIPFAFVHIPHGYDKAKARRLLLKVIQQLNGAETDTNRAATPRVNRGIH